MADQTTKNPHAIFVPLPLQGHLTPSVLLAIKLASKGFTITFVNTESIHHSITKSSSTTDDVFKDARKSGLDIRYVTITDGLPIEFDRSLYHDQFMECIFHVFSAHVDKLLGNMVECDPSISCLITDSFHVWPLMISKKYNLVNISFWTEPALILNLYYHLDLLKKNGHYDPLGKYIPSLDYSLSTKYISFARDGFEGVQHVCQHMAHNLKGPIIRQYLVLMNNIVMTDAEKFDEVIEYVPGIESIKPKNLMSYIQAKNTNTVTHRIIHKALFTETKDADFVLCNTIQELEPYTLSSLNQTQPFYAIGPIFSNNFTQQLVSTSLWSESDCTSWLDKRPTKSVLYISFGSYAHTSKHDLEEIAYGLLQSRVSFIWALRPDIISSNDTNPLPIGFRDQVKDRGLIVTWCNQKNVISHSSIGGFLTHCGWNSILESIWCEVPMICFPLLTDQFTNRKLVVDDWKIGLNLCEENLVERDEVARKVKDLVSEEKSNEMRVEIKKVKRTLEDAVAVGGSSQRNFDQFVGEVKLKIDQMK